MIHMATEVVHDRLPSALCDCCPHVGDPWQGSKMLLAPTASNAAITSWGMLRSLASHVGVKDGKDLGERN